MAQNAANRARDQAKIEADKELTLKELELQAQALVNTNATSDSPFHNKDAKSSKLPAFVGEKDKPDSYLSRMPNRRKLRGLSSGVHNCKEKPWMYTPRCPMKMLMTTTS